MQSTRAAPVSYTHLSQHILDFVGITDHYSLGIRGGIEPVILPAGTAKLRQCCALTTAGIPDCPGALHLITEQDGQPVP